MGWVSVLIGPTSEMATRVAGLAAHGVAAGAAVWRSRREAREGGRDAGRWWWVRIAVVQAVLLAAVRWDWVFQAADWGRGAVAGEWYQVRSHWLGTVAGAASGVAAIFVLWMAWRARRYGWGTVCGILGTGAAAGAALVQMISWHNTDAILYQRIGGLLLIGWMWVAMGAVVVVGAWGGFERVRKNKRRDLRG